MTARPFASGGPVGGDDAQRRAREELARPDYQHGHHSPGWIHRLADWLGRQLGRAGDVLTGGGGAFGHAALVAVLALAVVAVLLGVRAGRPSLRRRARPDEELDPLAPVDSRAHRALAESHAAQQRWADALREWLRAAVATVEERGILPPRPGRTGVTTALETAPVLPQAAEALGAAVRAFDEVWFGGRDATARDADAGRDAADAVARGRPRDAAGDATSAGLAAPW